MRRLGSGRIQVRYRDPAGRQRSFTADTVTEARRRQAEVRADLSRGRWRDPANLRRPFGDWATTWRSAWTVRATTAAAGDNRLRRHIRPQWADWPLGAIDHVAVQSWVNRLAETELQPATVAAIFNLFRTIMQAATDAELIPANPCRRVKLPMVGDRSGTVLSPEQAARLVAAFPRQRGGTMCLLTLGTGLRWGELAGLRRADVDLNLSTVQVNESLHEAAGRLWWERPKSVSSLRTLPLPSELAKVLARWMDGLDVSESPPTYGLLFYHQRGGPLRRSDFRARYWKPAKEAAKVDDGLRWHGLRKTFASWLEAGGVPRVTISELLGHKITAGPGEVPVTTRYVFSLPGVEERVIEVLAQALAPAIAAYAEKWG